MKKTFLTIAILLSLVASDRVTHVAHAASTLTYSGLVQCDGVTTEGETERQKKCDFAALVSMVNYIIRWLFGLTIPIFAGIGAYAGFLYMTPNPSNRTKANKMLWAAVVGFVIMLSAWLIVTTLLKWLVRDTFTGADALVEVKK